VKYSKLIKKLSALFDPDLRAHQRKKSKIKEGLKNIRHKQKELEKKLAATDSELEQRQLQEKISILTAQRAKGLELLKELEQE
jgi:predicted  nucleic acid-binding Zn-ribbon protein